MESLPSLYTSMFPPAPKWGFNDIPSLKGKVVIVTGGNTGIAEVMCRELLNHDAKLYILARSLGKADAAIADLVKKTGKTNVKAIQCDLADLRSVKRAAAEFLSKERQLHILFNSAGVMYAPMSMLTSQGYDLQFGTNVLGHFYLTQLLLPVLLSTAAANPGQVRVVTTSSSANHGAPSKGIIYEYLKDGPQRTKKGDSYMEYYMSKWGNAVYAQELGRRYGNQGLFSCALDPGWIRTNLWQYQGNIRGLMTGWMLNDVEHGALTPLYAGTAPEAAKCPNGQFFVPWARAGRARKDTEYPEAGKKLWEYCVAQVQAFEAQRS
ncbi:NADP-binding protein [Dacryopinax primogenitus]|uniref:NADP-binding protein n=1 Tax=Dacryopinax primogenitus (strain DJM 731) TaxID=1858805 RepID=M5FXS2_DACPD|nr:NADP-binding protein [Dacryopinax primogenitus]EJT98321.1 NADP-binding protein [Dacryopinax primogenitus]